jgi:Tol biopolymer transport system component
MDNAPPPSSELWIYDVTGEEFTEIMSAPGIDDHACWSPVPIGGHYLVAFDSTRDHFPDGDSDIYVVDPDTEEIVFHLDTGANEVHPSFSPDGLSFVFSMVPEDGEDSELFICTWQTGGLTQLTDDDTYDGSPSWGWNW